MLKMNLFVAIVGNELQITSYIKSWIIAFSVTLLQYKELSGDVRMIDFSAGLSQRLAFHEALSIHSQI